MAAPFDPKRDLPRIRDVEEWPLRPMLPVARTASDGDRLMAYIREEDVVADEEIRVFGTTMESIHELTFGTRRLEELDLPVTERYDSIERMLADGWEVD
jgi:hypothetical protein